MPSYLVLTTLTTQPELLTQVTTYLPKSAATNLISSINEPSTSPTIEQVRTMLDATHFTSGSGGKGMTWLLWNIQASSIPAQNALLKLLEEPPVDTTILLTTSRLEGVLPTIQSRCTVINLTSSRQNDISATNFDAETHEYLTNLVEKLNIGTIPELMSLADTMGTTVEEATQNLKNTITWIRRQPDFPTPKMTTQLTFLTAAHAALLANANVKLTLEHCFFEIVSSATAKNSH